MGVFWKVEKEVIAEIYRLASEEFKRIVTVQWVQAVDGRRRLPKGLRFLGR
jgi:hypothetical protein